MGNQPSICAGVGCPLIFTALLKEAKIIFLSEDRFIYFVMLSGEKNLLVLT